MSMMKAAVFGLTTAAAALALAPQMASAAPNLVQNGNFDVAASAAPSNYGNSNFELTAAGTYGTVSNWTIVNSPTNSNPYNLLFTTGAGANVAQTSTTAGSPSNSTANAYGQYSNSGKEYLASGYTGTSPTGGNFMALDGDSGVNGYLQQTVTGLTAGVLYELDFYWAVAELASASAATGLTDYLKVNFGSSTAQTQTVAIANQGFSGWMKTSFYFTAQSTSQALQFLSMGTPAGAPPMALLDGVSLTAAPEPSTLAVVGAGLAGLALVRRRRKGANKAA